MLKSSLGCFVLALFVAATSLLWAGIANWVVLIPAIPLALVALAAYLNFWPKGTDKSFSTGEKVADRPDEGQNSS